MVWFRRKEKGINTPTEEKKDVPKDIWYKTKTGKIIERDELKRNLYVSLEDGYHVQIGSEEYFSILFDKGKYKEIAANLRSKDILGFVDTKKYKSRLEATEKKVKLKDALRVGEGKINGVGLVIACMDFQFIGGSMGSVVGEKISQAVDHCIEKKLPLIIISKSGGARMMESNFSLMQMAKTSAKLKLLSKQKLPYISLLTDPTTGGVTASFAMLGDLNIAEPQALIGFAGPRVIRETIGKDLPEGFQYSEFLLEHGFLDYIIDRRELKPFLTKILKLILNKPI